jgi:ribosome-binding factor A
LEESQMKREKYYDFLWNWDNPEKGFEFENKAKEYLAFLRKDYSDIITVSVPAENKPYKEGYLKTLNDAIEWLEKIITHNTQMEYISRLLFVKETYHNKYLFFKKINNNEAARGISRAASDLYKGLTNLTQSMIEFQQSNQIPQSINESA